MSAIGTFRPIVQRALMSVVGAKRPDEIAFSDTINAQIVVTPLLNREQFAEIKKGN
jgi:hypothetical protein